MHRDRGKNMAVAGQKGRAMLGRGRIRAVAWQALSAPNYFIFCFLSLLKRAPFVLTKNGRTLPM